LTSPYEGVTYIATVLHNAGYPVRIVDARYERDPLKAAYDQIMAGTDVLGVATFEDNFPFVRELVAEVKNAAPRLPVICGGSLATSVPHVFMQETRGGHRGGERRGAHHPRAHGRLRPRRLAAKLRSVNGIWFRDADGRPVQTAPRGQMPHLDALPRMNLGLWPQARDPRGLQPQIIASYSRGCKLDCSFCYRTTPQERVKSAATLDRDLGHLKKTYGSSSSCSPTSPSRRTRRRPWRCARSSASTSSAGPISPGAPTSTRAPEGDEGGRGGHESLRRRVARGEALKEARKASSENATVRAYHQSWERAVRFGGLLIVGLPGENAATLRHACDWAEETGSITRVKYLSAMRGPRSTVRGSSRV